MKVLGVEEAAWPSLGGIETFEAGLGEYLSAQPNVEYRLVAGNAYSGENPHDYETRWAPDEATLNEWIAWADVVHTHVLNTKVLREARRLKKRIVNTNHDVTMICPKGDKMRWDGPCVNRAGPLVCGRCLYKAGSPAHHLIRPMAKAALSLLTDIQVVTSDWAARRYPLARKRVIPYGIDPEVYSAKTSHAQIAAVPSVVFMGRLVAEKGVQTLIEAAVLSVAAGRPFVAQVYGDGAFRGELEQHARRAGVEQWIEFRGRVDGSAKATALQGADIGVVPSLWEEAFGITAIEMMAVGLPVIASETGGLAGVVDPVGVLVARGDALALSESIDSLGQDEARREALGRAGRDEVVSKYTLERCHHAYHGLYLDIMGLPHPAGLT